MSDERKLTLDWVRQPDGSRAVVFDARTWAVFESAIAEDGKKAPDVLSTAVAACVGPIPNNRKLALDWAHLKDGGRALIFDAHTWAVFQNAADAKGKDARHMISAAVAECFGAIIMDNYTLNRFLPS